MSIYRVWYLEETEPGLSEPDFYEVEVEEPTIIVALPCPYCNTPITGIWMRGEATCSCGKTFTIDIEE